MKTQVTHFYLQFFVLWFCISLLLNVLILIFLEISTPRPSSPSGLPEEDSVLFNKLTYLGCMKVSSPRNEVEALRAMATMKSFSQYPSLVTLYVPNVPEGSVR